MSLTSALANANSGLAANSLRADVTANNIANATNPNYARRSVNSTASALGGVGTSHIERAQDLALSRLRRGADAAAGRSGVLASAYSRLGTELGRPNDGYGLFASLENFESALKALEATPESVALQNAVVEASREISTQFQTLSDFAVNMREEADQNIARNVNTVNAALYRLQEINGEIGPLNTTSESAAILEDERQTLINTISEIIPVRDIERDNGRVEILTQSGVFLLSNTVHELNFNPSPVIPVGSEYGQTGSPLSGLFVGDQEITPGQNGVHSLLSGFLAGEFAVRDEIAPGFNRSLDALAVDLITRFSDDSIDPTKVAGLPGIFTDDGMAHDPANFTGTAARIQINAAIDPYGGGEVRRIRDGIGSATLLDSGDTSIISSLVSAMTTPKTLSFQSGLSGQHSAVGAAAGLSSLVGEQTLRFESINASTTARRDTLRDTEISRTGVDTDVELQNLLLIEQAYAANARVIQTVGEMIDRLLTL